MRDSTECRLPLKEYLCANITIYCKDPIIFLKSKAPNFKILNLHFFFILKSWSTAKTPLADHSFPCKTPLPLPHRPCIPQTLSLQTLCAVKIWQMTIFCQVPFWKQPLQIIHLILDREAGLEIKGRKEGGVEVDFPSLSSFQWYSTFLY